MPTFSAGGLRFRYVDLGSGIPFVFQHGIGGDVRQPGGVFSPPPGVRLISFDARAHGQTLPLGDPATLRFDTFGDDLVALLDHLGLATAIVGGISMGAAVALNVAVRYPRRVAGLVLSRPAWVDGPMSPIALTVFNRIVHILKQIGDDDDRDAALVRLERDDAYAAIARDFPDAARSLRGQILEPRAIDALARLERLPRERPIQRLADAAAIRVPTLVLAHDRDPIHPLQFGVDLARMIDAARLVRLTPKSVDPHVHAAEVQRALTGFVQSFRRQDGGLALVRVA
jgi:pimeloyl-ACP methyl ester carboxylesterase